MANKKLEAIKKKSDFFSIKNKGKTVRLSRWLLINYRQNQIDNHRLGMTIPKKIGNSVIRNKLKRWCRVFFQKSLSSKDGPGVDINVVFLGSDKEFFRKLEFKEISAVLETGVVKIRKHT